MHVDKHVAAGAVAGIGAGWLVSPAYGAVLFAGSVFIDVDHYLWYVLRFHDYSIRRAVDFYRYGNADSYYCLCVLHTLEFIALYCVCLWQGEGVVFWLAAGCLLHIVLDAAQSAWDHGLLQRRWSLIGGIVHALREYYAPRK